MNVAELSYIEQLILSDAGPRTEFGDTHADKRWAEYDSLARRVIAAEKLVESATKFMAAYHSGKNIHGHADNIDNVLKNINSDRECF